MAILDSLLVELGFEYNPKDLEAFKEDLDQIVGALKSLAKLAISAATAITAVTTASTMASDEQGKLANEIGETVETIDALQFAARRAGDSSEGMASSLQNLSIRASEASRGLGSGVEAFGLLGISVADVNGKLKPASELLLEVSKQMQGLDNARQIELADKLGLRDSIRLLQQGPSAIRELTKEAERLGVTTAEDAAIAEQYQDSLADLWQITKDFSRTLTRVMLPATQEMVTMFTDWWKINRDMVMQNLPQFIEKLTFGLKLLSAATAAFIALKLVALISALPTLFVAATLAVKGFLATLFTLPVLIATIIAAVALLAEDARAFFAGQESLIGDLIEKYPEWERSIRSVARVFAILADLTEVILDGWKSILNLDFSFSGLKDVAKNLPGFLGETLGLNVNNSSSGSMSLPQAGGRSSSVSVGEISITVPGAGAPEETARAVMSAFQQASQDLASTVDI